MFDASFVLPNRVTDYQNTKHSYQMSVVEPILEENKDRFVIFPIQHHDLWEWYG